MRGAQKRMKITDRRKTLTLLVACCTASSDEPNGLSLIQLIRLRVIALLWFHVFVAFHSSVFSLFIFYIFASTFLVTDNNLDVIRSKKGLKRQRDKVCGQNNGEKGIRLNFSYYLMA